MKPLLFRAKIAFLSLAMSGLLVVGFGIVCLVIIGRVGMSRIDNEIRALGEAQLRSRHPPAHWPNFDNSLEFIYGNEAGQRFAVRVLDRRGEPLFTSRHWPSALDRIAVPDLLPAPSGPHGALRAGPEPPAERDRPSAGDRRPGPDVRRPAGPLSQGPAGFPPPYRPRLRKPAFVTVDAEKTAWRVGFMGNDSVTLIVAADLAALQREAAVFRNAFLLVTPLALLILGLSGWALASRAMRPVADISRTAETITASDLDRRISTSASDAELQRLVDVINGMLERLERSFHQAARFSADAAHELQTPLTVLQGELDNAVQEAPAGSDEQQRYSGLLEEVRGLKAVMQKLLLLARADVGRLPLSLQRIDFSDFIRTAIEDVETMAPHLAVENSIAPGVCVEADAALLGQVLRNMTSNAVKYNREGGTIRFELSRHGTMACFTLANTGPTIPDADREKIFNRFHRVDKARSRQMHGTGLGLSLAREIARAHGGDLVLGPERAGLNVFTLTLPLA